MATSTTDLLRKLEAQADFLDTLALDQEISKSKRLKILNETVNLRSFIAKCYYDGIKMNVPLDYFKK